MPGDELGPTADCPKREGIPMSDYHRISKHPDAKWVMSRKDLPLRRAPARFKITHKDGSVFEITLSKRKRQVLELLCRGKVFCASPVRISQFVCLLKHEDGINIFTEIYTEETSTECGKYGIYRLDDEVEFLGEVEFADG
ncbi:MAG: hypothetical protein ACI875_000468 [Planctomycetota bacterium]